MLDTAEISKNVPNVPGIYMFTNLMNNKRYIGQSIVLRKRILHHLNNFAHSRYNAPIYRAFRKYGIENFELTILEVLEKDEHSKLTPILDEFEKKYIKEYNSFGSTGYNQTYGGDGGVLGYKMTKEQRQKISEASTKQSLDGRYKVYAKNIHTGEITEAINGKILSEKLNITYDHIKEAKHKHRIYKNTYIFANNIKDFTTYHIDTKIINNYKQLKLHYKTLKKYYDYLIYHFNYSINDIAKDLNISVDTIKKYNLQLQNLGWKFFNTKDNCYNFIDITNITTSEKIRIERKQLASYLNITKKNAANAVCKGKYKNFRIEKVYV